MERDARGYRKRFGGSRSSRGNRSFRYGQDRDQFVRPDDRWSYDRHPPRTPYERRWPSGPSRRSRDRSPRSASRCERNEREYYDRNFSQWCDSVNREHTNRPRWKNKKKFGKNDIPERWLDYTNVGCPIPGTSIVALKVPLREGIVIKAPADARFGPDDVPKLVPNIGMVLDLTATSRYYNPKALTDHGIKYRKIECFGQVIPQRQVVSEFFRVMDDFLADPTKGESLIGVHCTHGVNRTGYLICRYLIERLGHNPNAAIEKFEAARGHKIERDLYVQDLFTLSKISPALPPAKPEESDE